VNDKDDNKNQIFWVLGKAKLERGTDEVTKYNISQLLQSKAHACQYSSKSKSDYYYYLLFILASI
jgi:hypothetical protein